MSLVPAVTRLSVLPCGLELEMQLVFRNTLFWKSFHGIRNQLTF